MQAFAEHASCSGCSLCLLACPVWQQRADVRLTPHGRSKAQQHGALAADLAASAGSCTVCMACEPICPERLPLVEMVLALRSHAPLGPARIRARMEAAAVRPPGPSLSGKAVLIPTPALSADPARLQRILRRLGAGFVYADDDGADIALALEAGVPVPESRRIRFFGPLENAREVVVADGLLMRDLRTWFAGGPIRSLGEALSANPAVRGRLGAGDLYVIEPRAFHVEHERLVRHYDALREERGCAMNLDLQRLAIPTTAGSAQHALGLPAIDVARQTQWILEGLKVDRVVVEDLSDCSAFATRGLPVLHIGDL